MVGRKEKDASSLKRPLVNCSEQAHHTWCVGPLEPQAEPKSCPKSRSISNIVSYAA